MISSIVPIYEIKYFRGDFYPKTLTFTNKKTKLPIDLTGMVLTLTVNTENNPVDDTNQLFQIIGVIDDPKTGTVTFTPAIGDNDLDIKQYYFDVEAVIGTTFKKTLMKGVWSISQDINKD